MAVDTGAADDYFDTRLGAADYWTSSTEKEAALVTAENQILAVYGVAPDATCIFEQALFLLKDLGGIERRASLQAQGVQSAGVLKETYRKNTTGLPMAPYVVETMGDPGFGFFGGKLTLDTDGTSSEVDPLPM